VNRCVWAAPISPRASIIGYWHSGITDRSRAWLATDHSPSNVYRANRSIGLAYKKYISLSLSLLKICLAMATIVLPLFPSKSIFAFSSFFPFLSNDLTDRFLHFTPMPREEEEEEEEEERRRRWPSLKEEESFLLSFKLHSRLGLVWLWRVWFRVCDIRRKRKRESLQYIDYKPYKYRYRKRVRFFEMQAPAWESKKKFLLSFFSVFCREFHTLACARKKLIIDIKEVEWRFIIEF